MLRKPFSLGFDQGEIHGVLDLWKEKVTAARAEAAARRKGNKYEPGNPDNEDEQIGFIFCNMRTFSRSE